MIANCQQCGAPFEREPDEHWKKLCLDCWKESKFIEKKGWKAVQAQLQAQMPSLLSLCHPDRHSNSEKANRVTQWLLEVRRELK